MVDSSSSTCACLADRVLIEAYRNTATSLISDNLQRLPGAVGLRPFHRGGTMAGTALTVRTSAGDNLAIHQALELVQPGHVLVIDGNADTSRALIGEIIVSIALSRGAVGLVVDGAVRDTAALRRSDFPCFARAAIHRGPFKNGPGDINVPVTIGGMIVQPGDIVVGDDDGVVAFPQAVATKLLEAVRKQAMREEEILESIREGRYAGAYGR